MNAMVSLIWQVQWIEWMFEVAELVPGFILKKLLKKTAQHKIHIHWTILTEFSWTGTFSIFSDWKWYSGCACDSALTKLLALFVCAPYMSDERIYFNSSALETCFLFLIHYNSNQFHPNYTKYGKKWMMKNYLRDYYKW